MDPAVLKDLLGLDFGQNVEIPRNDLVIPEEFQRELRPRNWGSFVPALFGRITAMEVDGVILNCDGIHRVREGDSHGMWEAQGVPSVLFEDGTKELAAAIFHLGNSERTSVPQADQFRAACISGDVEMQLLDADLLDIGLDGWCKDRADRNLGSIGTVVGLATKYDRGHALYALDTIGSIWSWSEGDERFLLDDKGDPQTTHPNPRMIKGFGEYLRPAKKVLGRTRLRRWDRDDTEVLVEYIAREFGGAKGHELFTLKAQARRLGGGGGGSAVGMEEQIHECYLRAKREQRGEDAE